MSRSMYITICNCSLYFKNLTNSCCDTLYCLSKWFSQVYGFVIFHQTAPVTLMYFWQKALFQILDSMGMVLSGPIRWVLVPWEMVDSTSISGFQVTGIWCTLGKEALLFLFFSIYWETLKFSITIAQSYPSDSIKETILVCYLLMDSRIKRRKK